VLKTNSKLQIGADMKKIFGLMILTAALTIAGFAQEKTEKAMPTDADKTANFDAGGMLKRGAPLSDRAPKVSLAKAMKNPQKYAGKNVLIEGVIVRSCKMEGCWMELAPSASPGARAIRISMKKHAFFIPLQAAGFKARAEGVFSVKTLSKAQVDHLINDDGAKFDRRNPDGSVMEVAFDATGVELSKGSK
jgi:hypothetical protein